MATHKTEPATMEAAHEGVAEEGAVAAPEHEGATGGTGATGAAGETGATGHTGVTGETGAAEHKEPPPVIQNPREGGPYTP